MSANGYTVTDNRPRLFCSCGCGQEATLPHFHIFISPLDGKNHYILPGCKRHFAEEQSALLQLRGLVRTHRTWRTRALKTALTYRLQRIVHQRHASGRRTAFRSALIFALPRPLGLFVARFWRWP
jgi:hypothetical protein